jgi:hypothetical protein
MPIGRRRRLEPSRHYAGQRAGHALVAWLNGRQSELSWLNPQQWKQKVMEELLEDATVVFGYLPKYPTHHEFYVATKTKKSPKRFWECYERVNKTLLSFTQAPYIELHEFYEGNPITWTVAEDSPLALLGRQIGWFIELIKQGAILKVRKCQQCTKWYFARFSHQEFCNDSCRGKHHSGTEAFKERRRKYMREYYRLKNSGKVK